MLDDFIANNKGRLVSFDGVPDHAGNSMQLVALWCKTIGLPFRWPAPKDWFNGRTDDNFHDYWITRHDKYANLPRPGDVVIFEDDLPGGDGTGHASIFIEGTTEAWDGFDADWDGEAAHIQHHDWVYVKGWFTPKLDIQAAAPVIERRSNLATMLPPVRIGDPEDTVLIDKYIPRYDRVSAAEAGTGSTGVVPLHKYFVYRRLNGMWHLTRTLGQPMGIWINPKDLEDSRPDPDSNAVVMIETAGKSVAEVLAETVPSPTVQERIQEIVDPTIEETYSDFSVSPPVSFNTRIPRQRRSDSWDLSPIERRTALVKTHYAKLYAWMLVSMKAIKEKYKEL